VIVNTKPDIRRMTPMMVNTKTPPRKRQARTTKTSKAMPTAALADISLKDDVVVGTPEASRLTGLSQKTLRQMRCERTGPRWLKLGDKKQSRAAYRRSDLERWIESRVVSVGGQS
jgi:predicted DNA-binding transcriptional regulator AlpA